LIGVISDTHDLLRPQALKELETSDLILHAGDITSEWVLDELRGIAPVYAVRGNNDRGDWANALPETLSVDLGGVSIYMIHNIKEMKIDPAARGHDVVIYGHSHKPVAEYRGDILYLNPGSPGRRRFKLPVSMAFLRIIDGSAKAKLIDIAL
jgi:putative phosphoesterase